MVSSPSLSLSLSLFLYAAPLSERPSAPPFSRLINTTKSKVFLQTISHTLLDQTLNYCLDIVPRRGRESGVMEKRPVYTKNLSAARALESEYLPPPILLCMVHSPTFLT